MPHLQFFRVVPACLTFSFLGWFLRASPSVFRVVPACLTFSFAVVHTSLSRLRCSLGESFAARETALAVPFSVSPLPPPPLFSPSFPPFFSPSRCASSLRSSFSDRFACFGSKSGSVAPERHKSLHHGPRTTDHGPRTTDHRPRTTDHGPRTTDHG